MYLFVFVILFLSYCNSVPVERESRIVDLTWPFDNSTVYWTGVRPFEFTKEIGEYRSNEYWYSSKEFCAGEHGGTHMDAPYHFREDGWQIGDIPVKRFCANGVLIDISAEMDWANPRNLEVSDIVDWEKTNGEIPNHSVVFIKFGWSKYYCDRDTYLGEYDDKMHFPGISKSAAEWLAANEKIVGVGVDVASIDPGESTNFFAHRALAKSNIYILENVKFIESMPARNFIVVSLPMYIQYGSGAPVRIIAVVSTN